VGRRSNTCLSSVTYIDHRFDYRCVIDSEALKVIFKIAESTLHKLLRHSQGGLKSLAVY
jgi:hypothetical protein